MSLPTIGFNDVPHYASIHCHSICWDLDRLWRAWRENWPEDKRITALDILRMKGVSRIDRIRAACHLLPQGIHPEHEKAYALHSKMTRKCIIESVELANEIFDPLEFRRTYRCVVAALEAFDAENPKRAARLMELAEQDW